MVAIMNCVKCGTPLLEGARFCQSCGTSVAEAVPAAVAQNPVQRHKRTLIAAGLAGGVIVIAIGVLLFIRHQSGTPEPAAATTQPTASAPAPGSSETPAVASATATASGGFEWSGLSPDEVIAARAALDQAITKEEKDAAPGTQGVPAAPAAKNPTAP
jgi:hypothetical protein